MAGFEHHALVEIDNNACHTLRLNRPKWNVIEDDIKNINGNKWSGIDLFAGGVPCPPFSAAGKQLGRADERDLFPEALRLISEVKPKAVMLENVRGLLDAVFDEYRAKLLADLKKLGYATEWRLLNASDFGVPQLRPRVVIVALQKSLTPHFEWPTYDSASPLSVGEALSDLMAENGWLGASAWKKQATDIGPTLVGGSKKHGGPDLGPTRARRAWASLGVDGRGIADLPPDRHFVGMPKLTIRMAARIQGFPDTWKFYGRKTAAYRQIGNAFPPPVAAAVGKKILEAFQRASRPALKRA